MAQKWEPEAEVAPGIIRVRSGELSAWFLVDGDEQDLEANWPEPAPERGEIVDAGGTPRTGILVGRQEGGMLVDSLRRHGGLSSEQTIGVLLECLAALDRLPDPPPGRTRVHRQAFAIDAAGLVCVVPCRTEGLDEVSPPCEFGELAYLCLTGQTWQEKAMPVRDLAQAPLPPLAELVIELLEGDAGAVPPATSLPPGLAVRLASIADPAPVPFVPSEPEVPVGEAVTAQLRLDAGYLSRLAAPSARAEEGKRPPSSAPDSSPPGIGRLRGAARRGTGRRGATPQGTGRRGTTRQGTTRQSTTRQGTGRRGATPQGTAGRGAGPAPAGRPFSARSRAVLGTTQSRWRIVGAGAAAAALLCGAVLLLTPGADRTSTAVAGPQGLQTSAPPAASSAPAESTATESVPAMESGPSDPVAAFEQLTTLREEAYETGDPELLRSLTVRGSPAATADQTAAIGEFAGSDVDITVRSIADPVVTGQTAVLTISMRTAVVDPAGARRDYGVQDVEVELRMDDGSWRVFQVTITG
ncbi:hypothetical protein GCM10022261_31320 [Brevibacterium daeguense]|uniref:Uncharacterized protein n=1 Tax=Brevibacterium daeguense TaxID=909936 RepID=A0ABP8ENN5_9MICO|nr:hypothetical protein [Brevibacterium daeguense]